MAIVATESQTPSRSFGPPPPPLHPSRGSPTLVQGDTDSIELENRALRQTWLELRRVRRNVEQALQENKDWQRDLQHQLNAAELYQEQQLLEFQSLVSRQRTLSRLLHHSQRWNALNDCFRIATKGAYATINGLRLGADAPVLECGNVDAMQVVVGAPLTSSNGQQASMTSPPAAGGPFSFFASFPGGSDPSSASMTSASSPATHHHKVPWSEINAALGHVVLLLSELQHRLNRCNTSSVAGATTTAVATATNPASSSPDPHSTNASLLRYRHDLLPLGSTSKIGIRKSPGMAPTWYNLWYSDETFQFFGRRNFNVALTGLMECVWDAVHIVQQHDRTVALPHDLVLPSQHSPTVRGAVTPTEIVIDGLPVSYFGADGRCGGVEWTRAMKYILTNLKYLLTVRLVTSCGGSFLLDEERGTDVAPASAS